MEEKKVCPKCGRILEPWEIEEENSEQLCSACQVAQEGEEMSKTPHN